MLEGDACVAPTGIRRGRRIYILEKITALTCGASSDAKGRQRIESLHIKMPHILEKSNISDDDILVKRGKA